MGDWPQIFRLKFSGLEWMFETQPCSGQPMNPCPFWPVTCVVWEAKGLVWTERPEVPKAATITDGVCKWNWGNSRETVQSLVFVCLFVFVTVVPISMGAKSCNLHANDWWDVLFPPSEEIHPNTTIEQRHSSWPGPLSVTYFFVWAQERAPFTWPGKRPGCDPTPIKRKNEGNT